MTAAKRVRSSKFGESVLTAAKACWRLVELPGVCLYNRKACGRLVDVHGVHFDRIRACCKIVEVYGL